MIKLSRNTDEIISFNVHGIIEEESRVLEELAKALDKALEADQPYFPISIVSYGGNPQYTMAMIDLLDSSPLCIVTSTTGYCMSAGLLLLSSGDIRYGSKSTNFLHHSMSSQSWGKVEEMFASVENDRHYIKLLARILARNTNKSRKWWLKKGKTDYFFNSEAALELGVITKIGVPVFNKGVIVRYGIDNEFFDYDAFLNGNTNAL